MSFLDAALAASGSVHDTLYGETFLVEPRVRPDPNGRSSADPARLTTSIVGVWTEPQDDVNPLNRTGHPAAESAKFNSTKPMIDYATVALPYDLAIGDFVTRGKTGTRYTVSDTNDDGFARSTARLTSVRGNLA